MHSLYLSQLQYMFIELIKSLTYLFSKVLKSISFLGKSLLPSALLYQVLHLPSSQVAATLFVHYLYKHMYAFWFALSAYHPNSFVFILLTPGVSGRDCEILFPIYSFTQFAGIVTRENKILPWLTWFISVHWLLLDISLCAFTKVSHTSCYSNYKKPIQWKKQNKTKQTQQETET